MTTIATRRLLASEGGHHLAQRAMYPCKNNSKIGGPQYKAPNTLILTMGAPKKVPLIYPQLGTWDFGASSYNSSWLLGLWGTWGEWLRAFIGREEVNKCWAPTDHRRYRRGLPERGPEMSVTLVPSFHFMLKVCSPFDLPSLGYNG